MRKLLIIVIAVLPQMLLAQGYATNRSRGRIEIKGDVAVTQLVQKHIELNERVRTIPGYRIQIAYSYFLTLTFITAIAQRYDVFLQYIIVIIFFSCFYSANNRFYNICGYFMAVISV